MSSIDSVERVKHAQKSQFTNFVVIYRFSGSQLLDNHCERFLAGQTIELRQCHTHLAEADHATVNMDQEAVIYGIIFN